MDTIQKDGDESVLRHPVVSIHLFKWILEFSLCLKIFDVVLVLSDEEITQKDKGKHLHKMEKQFGFLGCFVLSVFKNMYIKQPGLS